MKKRKKVRALILSGAFLFLGFAYFLKNGSSISEKKAEIVFETQQNGEEVFLGPEGSEAISGSEESEVFPGPETEERILYVDIGGAVAVPGVYEVKPETRIFEVIALAGGALPEANLQRVNQALPVQDGEKIYVPFFSDEEAFFVSGSGDERINLNTASAEELQTLSGIGEAKANAIIEYRKENGRFSSIEEIMNISGIGQSLFEKIKDRIKVSL